MSTLERALTTPHVREQLGIEFVSGRVMTAYPKPEVLKGLTKLVDEIGSGKVKVADFMSKEDRAAYVDRFKDAELPDPGTRTDTQAPLDEAPEKVTRRKPDSKDRRHSAARTKLIPSDFSVSIPVSRINDIYIELKRKLQLADVPNAAAVLLRVFIELSMDELHRAQLGPRPVQGQELPEQDDCRLRLHGGNGVLTRKQLIPVREALKDPNNITLPTNLNAYVHNANMTPTGTDLKAIWDRLAAFIDKLWA